MIKKFDTQAVLMSKVYTTLTEWTRMELGQYTIAARSLSYVFLKQIEISRNLKYSGCQKDALNAQFRSLEETSSLNKDFLTFSKLETPTGLLSANKRRLRRLGLKCDWSIQSR